MVACMATSMAAQEMNAELHVGDVITKRRRQLYTGADATLMKAAFNLCKWKLKHNIKTAAFERLSKLLKKLAHATKGRTELTETTYQVEQ
eukprot:jgi/Tetstr1/460954/TSEL_006106.t1